MSERILYAMILSGIGTLVFGAAGIASAIGILHSALAYPAMIMAGACVLALAMSVLLYAQSRPTSPPPRYRGDMFANTYKWRIE
ncbi:MAG: hypothetical protein AB1513_11120 [Pseudomonadota bacterium]